MAVVDLLKSRTSSDNLVMHLLRCLVFYAAVHSFSFAAEHIPGHLNTAADAISRNNLPLFHSLIPQVDCCTIPPVVMDLLVAKRPNWGSVEWTRTFATSLNRGSPTAPAPPTTRGGDNTVNSARGTASRLSHSVNMSSATLQQPWPTQSVGGLFAPTSVQ